MVVLCAASSAAYACTPLCAWEGTSWLQRRQWTEETAAKLATGQCRQMARESLKLFRNSGNHFSKLWIIRGLYVTIEVIAQFLWFNWDTSLRFYKIIIRKCPHVILLDHSDTIVLLMLKILIWMSQMMTRPLHLTHPFQSLPDFSPKPELKERGWRPCCLWGHGALVCFKK